MMILQQQTCLNTAACPKILAWVEANLNDTHTLLYFLFIHMREKWKQLLGNSTVVTCQQIARFLIEKVTFYLFPYVYEDTVKSSRPSLCETRDKRPLGRDPDKSLSHRHTSVKLSWSQPMDPWTERQQTTSYGLQQKSFALECRWQNIRTTKLHNVELNSL